MSCAPHSASGRKFVKKLFEPWKTKLLLTVGVETIGPAISERWGAHRSSHDFLNFEPVPTDFNAGEEPCSFCLLGSPDFKGIMSVKDDSGVSSNSTTPAVSPRVDVLNSLCNNQEQMNPEMLQQMMYQQAMQMEMFHNMQLMMGMHLPPGAAPSHMNPMTHMVPVAPHLPFSAEMQKMILEGQVPFPNPAFLAQQQFNWYQMMMNHMHRMQHVQPESKAKEPPPKLHKDEKPLDLSRKSGLEGILEIEAAHLKKNHNISSIVEEASTPYDSDGSSSEMKFRPPKRNYTQVDLDAAVNDIRNGKLGTRRASVVYGIPRSTLRNKIYKLEAADELTGILLPYKRQRKQPSSGEKKSGEPLDPEKISSDSPSDESSNNSNDQTIGNADDDSGSPPKLASIQETIEAVRLNSANGWPASIWAQLFSSSASGSPERETKSSKARKEEIDWKKSRPKRGQYRKYDKNALDEAVQSVRRGEMSVHRAGSFYGVPHSTLEYKVKERNLMRKKKGEDGEKNGDDIAPGAVDLALRNLQEVLSN